jgi:hypothetical protein
MALVLEVHAAAAAAKKGPNWASGLGFRVEDLGFRDYGFGFRV